MASILAYFASVSSQASPVFSLNPFCFPPERQCLQCPDGISLIAGESSTCLVEGSLGCLPDDSTSCLFLGCMYHIIYRFLGHTLSLAQSNHQVMFSEGFRFRLGEISVSSDLSLAHFMSSDIQCVRHESTSMCDTVWPSEGASYSNLPTV